MWEIGCRSEALSAGCRTWRVLLGGLIYRIGQLILLAHLFTADKLSNNYISSMQFCFDNSLILSPNLNNSVSLHRNIRIKSSRLPHDFFNHLATDRYAPSPARERTIAADISNRSIRTPSFDFKKRQAASKDRQENYRKVETARPSLEKTQNSDDLISGILSTSKKLRKVFRKQSLEFKDSYSLEMGDKDFRLPKILNRGLIRKY